MSTITLSGSCLCGTVRYIAKGKEHRFYHCHCTRCRKASGTGHASNLFIKGKLEWQSGHDRISSFRPPGAKRFLNAFCSDCGSRMPRFDEAYGMVFIPAGSLDDEPGLQPEARIFYGSRAAWSCNAAELPEFHEYRS